MLRILNILILIFIIYTIFIVCFVWKANSFDGQISTSYTHFNRGYQTIDTQLNIGKDFEVARPFIQIDYIAASQQGIINDSQVSYIIGTEMFPSKNLKLEMGIGYYQALSGTITNNQFFYTKMSYGFNTNK
jgi:hypothetical protein